MQVFAVIKKTLWLFITLPFDALFLMNDDETFLLLLKWILKIMLFVLQVRSESERGKVLLFFGFLNLFFDDLTIICFKSFHFYY